MVVLWDSAPRLPVVWIFAAGSGHTYGARPRAVRVSFSAAKTLACASAPVIVSGTQAAQFGRYDRSLLRASSAQRRRAIASNRSRATRDPSGVERLRSATDTLAARVTELRTVGVVCFSLPMFPSAPATVLSTHAM